MKSILKFQIFHENKISNTFIEKHPLIFVIRNPNKMTNKKMKA